MPKKIKTDCDTENSICLSRISEILRESHANLTTAQVSGMAQADCEKLLAEQHATCIQELVRVLPTLVTQADAAAVTWGDCLSPYNTVLCTRELNERMHKLGLEDPQHRAARVDVAVAIYSIALKLNWTSTAGFRGEDAWRIALGQKPHVWALYAQSARGAGELKHLAVLDVVMRSDWLLRIETSLVKTLGRGLWDVQRTQAVEGILRCVSEHIDIAACADSQSMLDPAIVDLYFVSLTEAVQKAAYVFLKTRIGAQHDLLQLVQAWLETLDTFVEVHYIRISKPVHVHELGQLQGQIEALVHAVVLLCEYVLVCGEASAKLAGLG